MRDLAARENMRADGRQCDEVRPIACRAGLLPCTHGSALFTRGETQTITVTTLGKFAPESYKQASCSNNWEPTTEATLGAMCTRNCQYLWQMKSLMKFVATMNVSVCPRDSLQYLAMHEGLTKSNARLDPHLCLT